MNVPFIDLTRLEPSFGERWLDKVARMSRGAQFVGGAEVAALEQRLAGLLGVGHVIGCANGTDAMQLALRALGVGPGDTVLVPNATFWATVEAVVNVGASPVTVDVSLNDGAMDIDALRLALAGAKPKAAILVHLYGWGSGHLQEIRALCASHAVALLEDGAQCFGASYSGASIFRDAPVATTSFYPAKVLGAAGDGGAVFTNDAALAGMVRQLGNHGRSSHYGHASVGWNSRLDALQAAYLNLSLDFVDQRIASRRASAARYRELLPGAGLDPLPAPPGYEENGYCNVCLVQNPEKKARLQARLRQDGIGFANIYPGVISGQPGARAHLKGHFGGTQAERLCSSVLNLPLFAYMRPEELDHVLATVRKWSQ